MGRSSAERNSRNVNVALDRARRLRERIAEEMRRFLVLFLRLWLLFGLFVLNEWIIQKQHGIDFAAQGLAVFNALMLAKVMLVLEALNVGQWLDRRPLVYPILHDALLFTVLFIAFHVTIRTKNTRVAYYRAGRHFFAWNENRRVGGLDNIGEAVPLPSLLPERRGTATPVLLLCSAAVMLLPGVGADSAVRGAWHPSARVTDPLRCVPAPMRQSGLKARVASGQPAGWYRSCRRAA